MGPTLTSEDRRSLSLAGAGVEVRADDNGSQRFVGHAAVFDQRTAIGNPLTWGFYEEIAPGAFTKTLTEQDVRMLIDHDSYYVVSRMTAGTLTLAEDEVGLSVDSALDTGLSYVADLIAKLQNGNVTGMSFGFYVVKDEWTWETVETSDGQTADVEIRRILEVKLIEVSSVTFPAFPQTDAALASERALRMSADDEVRAVGLALDRRPDGRALLEARSVLCPDLATFRDRTPPTGWRPGQQSLADLAVGSAKIADAAIGSVSVATLAPGAQTSRGTETERATEPKHKGSTDEPGETTRTEDTSTTDDEPGETTRRQRHQQRRHQRRRPAGQATT